MTTTPIAHSTYLDMVNYQLNPASNVATAYGFDPASATSARSGVIVALTLKRANDPTALLNENWADREAAITRMNADGTLWSIYGADPAIYNNILSALQDLGIPTLRDTDDYVSSPASRTIWLHLQPAQFQALFGTQLLSTSKPSGLSYWNGGLSLPSSIADHVTGLWLEIGSNFPVPKSDATSGVTLADGPLSPGSQRNGNGLYPNQIAVLYHAPLSSDSTVATPSIALIEPSLGDGHVEGGSFQSRLDAYRTAAGISKRGAYYAVEPKSIKPAGKVHSRERALDVGVVTTVAPNSRVGLYAGGDKAGVSTIGGTFSSDMAAVWDTTNNPADISSSFSDDNPAAPNSPFYAAYNDLWQDAALRNISVFFSAGDGGSQEQYGSGNPKTDQSHSSRYAVVVGGSSLSTFKAAQNDTTLATLLSAAYQHDPAALRKLMAGGLQVMPKPGENNDGTFVETVWNEYNVSKKDSEPRVGFQLNEATAGGVDDTQPVPSYQTNFGLTPTSTGTDPQTGRGIPDVASTSGGSLAARVPQADMSGKYTTDGGTSGAAPFWAALTAQIQAIFADQGLPSTGYFNDLLYQAAAVAPASFNDVAIGNNYSTYIENTKVQNPYRLPGKDGKPKITAEITGTAGHPYGYSAKSGYDLTTGLGTPNGLLLARALTAIAQAQMYSDAPALIDDAGDFTTTGALLVQPQLLHPGTVSVGQTTLSTTSSNAYAWSNQLAGQSMQAHYDPALLTMFDHAAEGTPSEVSMSAGEPLSVTVNGASTSLYQAADTSPFGFVQATTAAGDTVTVSRPLAVAQTAQGADDQAAIVRIRQNGVGSASLTFYRVDDYSGDINGIAPGGPGYAAAVFDRAYKTDDGSSVIAEPGYGRQLQTELTSVDSGDLIAFEMTSGGHQFWGLTGQNEVVNGSAVTHLWNYGMNVFGFEDKLGGGDRDYNDAVFQLDFTSASGNRLLA